MQSSRMIESWRLSSLPQYDKDVPNFQKICLEKKSRVRVKTQVLDIKLTMENSERQLLRNPIQSSVYCLVLQEELSEKYIQNIFKLNMKRIRLLESLEVELPAKEEQVLQISQVKRVLNNKQQTQQHNDLHVCPVDCSTISHSVQKKSMIADGS